MLCIRLRPKEGLTERPSECKHARLWYSCFTFCKIVIIKTASCLTRIFLFTITTLLTKVTGVGVANLRKYWTEIIFKEYIVSVGTFMPRYSLKKGHWEKRIKPGVVTTMAKPPDSRYQIFYATAERNRKTCAVSHFLRNLLPQVPSLECNVLYLFNLCAFIWMFAQQAPYFMKILLFRIFLVRLESCRWICVVRDCNVNYSLGILHVECWT